MGEEHERDAAWIEGEAAVLRVGQCALEHAAVDEEADFTGVDLEARAGDLPRGAVKDELHPAVRAIHAGKA